jgi:hypothetical protein
MLSVVSRMKDSPQKKPVQPYCTVSVKVIVAESAPLNALPPFVLATVRDKARGIAVALEVAGIETVVPLAGTTVNGPAVVAASPSVSCPEWVNPGVVNTTVVPL